MPNLLSTLSRLLSHKGHDLFTGKPQTKGLCPSFLYIEWLQDRALIGRYAAEHEPTKASRHFMVLKSTALLLKKQSLAELHDRHQNSLEIPQVTSLPTKAHGHPLLLGSTLDCHLKHGR